MLWENTTNEEVLEAARAEIRQSWRRACADNADHPRASELFDPEKLPAFHDPFAGGGAIPLEAQRLGLEAHASDLNPVAVLINKAMIEIPIRFAGGPPVNREARARKSVFGRDWRGAAGLAEDVCYYGTWMRDRAERRIGHLYPKARITPEMAQERPDLERYAGRELTVIAWLWARTVPSPNPAFSHVQVPLVSTFMLSTKNGKEAYVEPVVEGDRYRFEVRVGTPADPVAAKAGTKLGQGANFRCLVSGSPIGGDRIKVEGRAGRMGARLMAVVAEGDRERVYLPTTAEMESAAAAVVPSWTPDVEFLEHALGFRIGSYGLKKWSQLFTPRQLVALTTFSDLVGEAMDRAAQDALAAGLHPDGPPAAEGGAGARAYGDAIGVYLSFALDRVIDWNTNLSRWENKGQVPQQLFARQAIPMLWDFSEANPLGRSTGSFSAAVKTVCDSSRRFPEKGSRTCSAEQHDARENSRSRAAIVSTDPPYYDNVGYADLSDFFYVWLRRSLSSAFPSLFATMAVPKAEELVATPYRHGGRVEAERFFLSGMSRAIARLADEAHPAFPTSIYYAFKQSEAKDNSGVSSTGWETFLDAVKRSGFSVSGTWPMRTELSNRMRGQGGERPRLQHRAGLPGNARQTHPQPPDVAS